MKRHIAAVLLTAPLMQLALPQAAAQWLALGALAMLGASVDAGRADSQALLLSVPLGTLMLALFPQVPAFWGLSGVVHAGAAVLALRALGAPTTRWLGLWLAGGLMVKLALEHACEVPFAFDAGWAHNVVFAAHLTGAAAGLMAALMLNALTSPASGGAQIKR